jgi:hypothetical protein
MVFRKAHEGKHVGLGLIHQRCELRHFRTQLIGDLPPLHPCCLGIVLDEGGADEGCDDAPALAASMGQYVAHEVHAAALPRGVQHLGDGRLDALMSIGDDELDATQTAPCELAQKLRPERLGLGRPMPRTSRRPSLLTPTAIMTAAETMRPLSLTFT